MAKKHFAVAITLAVLLLCVSRPSPAAHRSEEEHHPTELERYRETTWAHFRSRCEQNSGERIYRTISGVDGTLLIRPRRQPSESELRDQYWKGDPYGYDSDGKAEIVLFLADLDANGVAVTRRTNRPGYDNVEIERPDGSVVRFRRPDPTQPPTMHSRNKVSAKYGVTWEDVSTSIDRYYWTAGSKLKVIDLSANGVLDERIGYLFEVGLGSTAHGRRPWVSARLQYSTLACPPFGMHKHINREFVEKVLRPRRTQTDAR